MPQTLAVEFIEPGVRLITLQRPQALNALNTQLLGELADELSVAQADPETRAVVLTGSRKAFAAGADIKEMAERDLVGILDDPRQASWQAITRFNKPLIAAVNGFALGGGCELAMHADIIIAGVDARFGQPEINLGIMPGAGVQVGLRGIQFVGQLAQQLGGQGVQGLRALQCNQTDARLDQFDGKGQRHGDALTVHARRGAGSLLDRPQGPVLPKYSCNVIRKSNTEMYLMCLIEGCLYFIVAC